jgi:hypothetical protein
MLEFSGAAQALRYLVNQNVGSNFVKNRCHLLRCINNFQNQTLVFQN